MGKYICERIFAMVLTLFVIMSIAFLVVRLMPGSVFEDNGEISQQVIDAMNAKYHFDEPVIVQYAHYLRKIVFHWDWGVSLTMVPNVPVFDVLRSRVPITMLLNLISLFVALPLGFVAGTVAALKKNTMVDHLNSFMVVLFISVPSFIFASLLQYFMAFKLGWFPIIYSSTGEAGTKALSMVLPVAALSFGPIARVARQLRAELSEAMNSEFMLLATTKGLTYRQATIRHAMRNALFPLVNIIVPMFTNIVGGSLVIENIFAIPGMGGLMVDSINANDHMLTVAILLFYSIISLATVLIVDILYGIIDPRVRIGRGKE